MTSSSTDMAIMSIIKTVRCGFVEQREGLEGVFLKHLVDHNNDREGSQYNALNAAADSKEKKCSKVQIHAWFCVDCVLVFIQPSLLLFTLSTSKDEALVIFPPAQMYIYIYVFREWSSETGVKIGERKLLWLTRLALRVFVWFGDCRLTIGEEDFFMTEDERDTKEGLLLLLEEDSSHPSFVVNSSCWWCGKVMERTPCG